jgi:hypothetical protein
MALIESSLAMFLNVDYLSFQKTNDENVDNKSFLLYGEVFLFVSFEGQDTRISVPSTTQTGSENFHLSILETDSNIVELCIF